MLLGRPGDDGSITDTVVINVGSTPFRVTPTTESAPTTVIYAFGIEGTGSYGAGLTSAVRRAGHRVVEVNRQDRRTRRANGKSDTIDAETAARSVLAGQSKAVPNS